MALWAILKRDVWKNSDFNFQNTANKNMIFEVKLSIW